MHAVNVIKPLNGDQAIADLYCQQMGRPPSEREWVCQHSCALESIPGCTDLNCEGTTITHRGDLAAVCTLIEQGRLELFDDMPVEISLAVDATLASALSNLAASHDISLTGVGGKYCAGGSLRAFARLTPQRIGMKANDGLRQLLTDIESTLMRQFDPVGPALFRQRFVDVRRNKNERGNALLFLAYDPQPLLVAWKAPRNGNKKPAPFPEIPTANFGFGIVTDGKATKLAFTDRHLAAVPGDYYGPYLRIFARVDQSIVDEALALCEECEEAPDAASSDALFSVLLSRIAARAGVATQTLPAEIGFETSYARSRTFLLNLLLKQPP